MTAKPKTDSALTAVGPIPVGERKTTRMQVAPVSLPIEVGPRPAIIIIDIDAQTDDPYELETQVFSCTGLLTCRCVDCLLKNLGE